MKEEIKKLKEAEMRGDKTAGAERKLFQDNLKKGTLKFYPGIQPGLAMLYDYDPLKPTIKHPAAVPPPPAPAPPLYPEALTSSDEEYRQQEEKRRQEEEEDAMRKAGLPSGFKLNMSPLHRQSATQAEEQKGSNSPDKMLKVEMVEESGSSETDS